MRTDTAVHCIMLYLGWVDAGNGTPEDEANVAAFRQAMTELEDEL